METNSPEAEPRRRKTLARKVMAFVIVTLVVAALGGFIGWMLGSIFVGALFGAVIGFYGCSRSGYVMDEPNIERPGF